MKKTKMEKGITLVALIITIIVLLILAVVTINAVKGDGIIQRAESATQKYNAAAENEQTEINSYIDKIGDFTTWKKTSEGELTIGSTVKHNTTGEEFYVIGGDTVCKAITSGTQKIILLAKNNLKKDGGLVQDPKGENNPCAFSTKENLSFELLENLNETLKNDDTSAVYKAIKYGEKLGATGRLMLRSEAEALETANSDILYGKNGKSSGSYLNYWLGSASDMGHVHNFVCFVYGYQNKIYSCPYNPGASYGVRPVVEVLKFDIS